MLKIASGPLVGGYGGINQHIKNIITHSKHSFRTIIPSQFSIYYSKNRFVQLFQWLRTTCKIERVDIYGIYLSNVLSSSFDIIHLHGHPYWPEIYHKPRRRYAKYIHTVHQVYIKEDFSNRRDWRIRSWLNKLMFKSCKESDLVISVAKWQQNLLLEQHIQSLYIPNGVNVKEFEAANPMRFREKYGISEDFFLFVGRLSRCKRPELFVKLASKMPGKLFVIIVGDVTLNNLRAYIKGDIPKNIMCLGKLSRHDVIDAFAACKVFVLPSKNETFGIVILEAMACKKPVVAANNAGPKEIITSGKDGYLFEPDNINDLYENSCKAWEHPQIGLQGYTKAKRKFDCLVIIKQIDKTYEKLV